MTKQSIFSKYKIKIRNYKTTKKLQENYIYKQYMFISF